MDRYVFTKQEKAVLERLKPALAVYQFVNKRVVTLALSDGFCELLGYEDREQAYHDMDNDMYRDTHPDDVARIANAAARFAAEGGEYDVVYRTRKKGTSDYLVVHAKGEHVYTDDGVRLAQVWYMNEGSYTEGAAKEDNAFAGTLSNVLREQSMLSDSKYDYLTGLPTMTYFFELAEAGKKAILQNGGLPMLLYIDFSGMRFFNTKHGFAVGDQMLRAFAKVIAPAFGSENCCHIGGDHFAAVTEEAGLEDRLKGIFHEFGSMYDGTTPPVHVGIYPHQIADVPTSTACDRAKLACSRLKGSYASAFYYYSDELQKESYQKQYILENLDIAIREKWIQVYVQPIIRAVSGKVCDLEALARWIDPEKGVLSPAAFIPELEEAGQIYKLDLYMIDRVLELIRAQRDAGIPVLPHSVNLSRSDFDACDIVEEIRKRVDAAGVDRDRITIEITESVIGSDFAFMKTQVERFQSLGFAVWMDDYGSGYSSPDILQSIRFDLLKFDMSFMRKLNEGDKGKIILTELMRMASSLGLDTVCEGVETEEQVRFLQEIGCSKLQGYYFGRPVPFQTIRELSLNHTNREDENPGESEYYGSISRVNLYDLGAIAGGNESAMQNTFSTIPIAILEVKEGKARYIRSNRSYQEFIGRFFHIDMLASLSDYIEASAGYGPAFIDAVRQCCHTGKSTFFDEKMPDGTVIHAFARYINDNPVTGSKAVAIVILSISEPNESMTYGDIAKALAADYYNIFVIDLDTDDFIEYSSQIGGEELSVIRHGRGFFESVKRDTMTRIYEEDREPFLKWFSKENVIRELDSQGVFTTTYRLIDTGEPMYVNMKITRLPGGNRIILGISIIDDQMKQQEEEKRLRQERTSLGRIAALSANYIVLYTVDPATGQYTQFNPSSEYARFGLATKGEDFFADVRRDVPKAIDPEDLERHLRVFTKENILQEIRRHGHFILNYRLMMEGKSVPVSLKAKLVEEDDGEKLILGVSKVFSREANTNESETIYTHIAHALARGYTDLFYVDMDTDEYIEYHTDDNLGVLTEARRGSDFFEGCKREARLFVHPDDQELFVGTMRREYLTEALDRSKVYEMTYRRIKDGRIFYVKMNVSRMEDDKRLVVIAVSDIDELMKKRRAEERIQEERIIYARLHALTGNFIVVYVVDPSTGHYREFSSTDDYTENLSQAKEGEKFFDKVREVARDVNHPDDLDGFLSAFTKENIMAQVEHSGIFTVGYRILMDGKPMHVQMKAAMVEEKEGRRLIVGLNDIDVQVSQEEEYRRRLAQAQSEASIDALTGVKNRHAYRIAERFMDSQIAEHRQAPFAVVIFDVNDLKKVNDASGHQAGDRYLLDACRIICEIFKHSPVFRVGGDEFAVIAQGSDYASVGELLKKVDEHNADALQSGGIVIACGVAKYENDTCVRAGFDRADRDMYDNKSNLKTSKQG